MYPLKTFVVSLFGCGCWGESLIHHKALKIWSLKKLIFSFIFPQALIFPSALYQEASGLSRKRKIVLFILELYCQYSSNLFVFVLIWVAVMRPLFIPFEINCWEYYSSLICPWTCFCKNLNGHLKAPNALVLSSDFRLVCSRPLSDRKSLSDEAVQLKMSLYSRTSSPCLGITHVYSSSNKVVQIWNESKQKRSEPNTVYLKH